jgi:hypothetical protein
MRLTSCCCPLEFGARGYQSWHRAKSADPKTGHWLALLNSENQLFSAAEQLHYGGLCCSRNFVRARAPFCASPA